MATVRSWRNGYALKTELDMYLSQSETWLSRSALGSAQLVNRHRTSTLHLWMLRRRLTRDASPLGCWTAYYLKRQHYNSRLALAEQIDQSMDPEVMAELRRVESCIEYSLDDYFLYSFSKKSLAQIVQQDLLSEHSPSAHLEKYIMSHVEHLNSLSLDRVLHEPIGWGNPRLLPKNDM